MPSFPRLQQSTGVGVCSLPRRLIELPCGGRGNSSSRNDFSCLPLQSSGGSASCSSAVSSFFGGAQRRVPLMGRRERLSSPPPKKQSGASLSVSAYSADLSSDSSLYRRRNAGATNTAQPNAPPLLAEPELFDDCWELDDAADCGATKEKGNGVAAVAQEGSRDVLMPRRGMARRAEQQHPPKAAGEEKQQFLRPSPSLTSGTSPSSSADSSMEPTNDNMTSSRGSFLELFGIRRRPRANVGTGRLGAFANAVDSLVARRMRGSSGSGWRFRKATEATSEERRRKKERTHSQLLYAQMSPPYSPAHSPFDGYCSSVPEKDISANKARMESEPNLNWRSASRDTVATKTAGAGAARRTRPQSCLLDPADCHQRHRANDAALERRLRTKSCKSVVQGERQQSHHRRGQVCAEYGGEELRLQMEMLRARNAHLVEQLREKSGQLSAAQAQANRLEAAMTKMRNEARFNSTALEQHRNSATQLALCLERAFDGLKTELNETARAQLQALKLDTQRQQQMALVASKRDRQALQASMAEVDRLQRENCALLQSQLRLAASNGTLSAQLEQRLELLPSYDALFSFSLGLVRKLGQMRAVLAQKCAVVLQLELDGAEQQCALLLAQIECQRAQALAQIAHGSTQSRKRPASFHGQQLAHKIANSRLRCLLPLKLQAQRLREQRAALASGEAAQPSGGFDALLEANEQSIELEFLRLFHSARSLSRICVEQEREKVSDDASVSMSPMLSLRRMLLLDDEQRTAKWAQREEQRNCPVQPPPAGVVLRMQRRTQSGGPNGSPPAAGVQLRRITAKGTDSDARGQNSPSSPLLKFRRLSAIFGGERPSTPKSSGTPQLTRRVPLPSSPRMLQQSPVLCGHYSVSQYHPHRQPSGPLLDQATPHFGFRPPPLPLCESPPPQNARNKPPRREHSLQGRRPPSVRRPSPSAPPLHLLNPGTLSRLPQPNTPTGANISEAARPPSRCGGTSSTRRPLMRSSASESPSLGEAKRFAQQFLKHFDDETQLEIEVELAKLARKEQKEDKSLGSTPASGSRSASMSRLPKAIAGARPTQQERPQRNEEQQKAEHLPRAVKKAGSSWLSRLRRSGNKAD